MAKKYPLSLNEKFLSTRLKFQSKILPSFIHYIFTSWYIHQSICYSIFYVSSITVNT